MSKRVPMPTEFAPMLATLGQLPDPADDLGFAYETKFDGMRAVAFVADGVIRLDSRNDNVITGSFPELDAMGPSFAGSELILDGEIVVLDAAGNSSFGRLQKRMHVLGTAEAKRLAASDPAVYMVFDVMHHDGRSTIELPYTERRALLESLDVEGPSWRTPRHVVGGGAELSAESKRLGLEGIMAKRLTSTYRPGRRSPDWIKVKNVRTTEVVVGGWKPGAGARAGTVGALLLGIPENGTLTYIGKVGTGFTSAALADLLRNLRRIERKTSPFAEGMPRADSKDAVWVTPSLVGEVAFSEWTADRRLRHPAWRGLRVDKGPGDVARET